MPNPKKQLKITKMFKRSAPKVPDICDELQEEVRELEKKLNEKQNEWFQIQRNIYRRKPAAPKKKEETFVRPQKIILNSSIETLKRTLELTSMLTGIEVQSYVAGEHCCVVFHMQHPSEHNVSHGLRIEMESGKNEISSMSLPLGFNLCGVMEGFDNIMKPECLIAIQRALVAYYDRLNQFAKLKKLVNLEAQLFKTLDGSHMQISLFVSGDEEEDQVPIILMLDYRVYDIRPKNYSIKEIELPEGAAEVLREQCAVFKEKPLHKAFKEAFLSNVWQYKLDRQVGPRRVERVPRPHKRFRPNGQRYHDDTFQPDDCSDQGDDDDDYID